MKRVLFVLFSLTAANVCAAQTNWFLDHPVWTNRYDNFLGESVETCQITGDTIIDGLTAQKIFRKRTNPLGNTYTNTRVVRQTGDSVWTLGANNQFKLLYNFALLPGEIYSVLQSGSTNLVYYQVDSTGITVIDGYNFRHQWVHISSGNSPAYICKIKIIEGIGAIGGNCAYENGANPYEMYVHFFLDEPDLTPLDGPRRTLCSYSNDNVSFKVSGTYCAKITPVDNIDNPQVAIMPNPFRDVLRIQAAGQVIQRVLLYDMYGKMVLEQLDTNDPVLNTTHLSNGIYFLEVRMPDGRRSVTPIVKCD